MLLLVLSNTCFLWFEERGSDGRLRGVGVRPILSDCDAAPKVLDLDSHGQEQRGDDGQGQQDTARCQQDGGRRLDPAAISVASRKTDVPVGRRRWNELGVGLGKGASLFERHRRRDGAPGRRREGRQEQGEVPVLSWYMWLVQRCGW